MDSVAEAWKPVVGHETTHEVSSLGRVKTLPRVVTCRNGARKPVRESVGFGSRNKALGYMTFHLGARNRYVHQLVLEAFVGPRPSRHEACHCNGDRSDNRLENLRWDTPQANQMDRAKHGTSNSGERCGTSKLTAEQARHILRSTERTSVLAKMFGVAPQTISGVRCGHKWKHLQEAVA